MLEALARGWRVGTSVQPSGKVEPRSVPMTHSTTFYSSKLHLRTSRILIRYFTQPTHHLIAVHRIIITFGCLTYVKAILATLIDITLPC